MLCINRVRIVVLCGLLGAAASAACAAGDPGRSDEARIQDLRMTGHALVRDGQSAEARAAFRMVLGLTEDARWLAEAHRMLGQIAFGLGDFDEALQAFRLSVTHALIEDPDGRFMTTASSISQACAVAGLLERHGIALDYARIGLGLERNPEPGPFYHSAYLASKGLGDTEAAAGYLDELLERRPDYGMDELFMGLGPRMLVERHVLRGEGWEHPSPEFMRTLRAIVSDERYVLMPVRAEIAEQYANLLDKRGDSDAAARMADSVVRTAGEAAGVHTEDVFLLESLGRACAELALQNALRKRDRLDDDAGAMRTITLLLESGLPLSEEVEGRARGLARELGGDVGVDSSR